MNAKTLASLAFVCICATVCQAQPWVRITETRYSNDLCNGDTFSYPDLAPGQDGTFNLSTCAARVNITVSGPTVDIGRLTFTGGGVLPIDFVLGSGPLSQADTPRTLVGRDWDGIDTSGLIDAFTRFAGGIGGDLTRDITVDQMFRFDVAGEVIGDINLAQSFGQVCVLEAGSTGALSDIILAQGDIRRIKTVGNLLGDVFAQDGDILRVQVGGNLGSSTVPVTIQASEEIDIIDVTGDIGHPNMFATIDAGKDDGDDLFNSVLLIPPRASMPKSIRVPRASAAT